MKDSKCEGVHHTEQTNKEHRSQFSAAHSTFFDTFTEKTNSFLPLKQFNNTFSKADRKENIAVETVLTVDNLTLEKCFETTK